ncbi:SET domain-containing protein [Decorospora gaudefroyi]|uniref:SET domain-containing protein n=1 Tax=Decorospora gaudefroyi TaxID=184978 RepID=A0A6A5KA10_9PLEO|nr:SET domain-containing protein [Decorospora gaudefroyi]
MATPQNSNTIYLTEQEAERIRSTVKERIRKCSEQNGNAKEPRDKTAAHQQATGAALMADMGGAPDPDMTQTQGKGANTIPAIEVGQPYPPCTASLSELESMEMADLRMETHHRGRKLVVKRESPVVTLVARSWTVVQGENGSDTERLEICLYKSRHGEDILESAKLFIIKEPYFTLTDQGEPTLRIDHPSDLVICHEEANKYDDAAAAEKAATRYKTQGNMALKQQDLPLAHEKYTAGLAIARQAIVSDSNPDLARDIARNRAYVNLLLGQLDEVKTDARASLVGRDDQKSKDLDSKAYYRAGSAAYQQGRYQEAKRSFQDQQKLTPEDKDAKIQLKRIEARLREEDTGSYDFTKIRTGLSRARPYVDAADFIKNTEIKSSSGKGRGLFATRDIAAGELIMCEKGFCVVWGHEEEALTAMTYDVRDERIRFSPVGLSKALVQKLLSNPSQIEPVMHLYGDYTGDNKNIFINDDGAIVDVFRIHDIMSRNGYGPGSQFGEEESAQNASTGLWIHAAYINHSCVPNARKECIGDIMLLHATRPIKTGDEIFHAYDETLDYDARQKALLTTWGFECKCGLCAAEKADGKPVRDSRMELADEADAFVDKTPWAGAKRLGIRKAQRLAKAIDETYDQERWKDLPRKHGEGIRAWLLKASPR